MPVTSDVKKRSLSPTPSENDGATAAKITPNTTPIPKHTLPVISSTKYRFANSNTTVSNMTAHPTCGTGGYGLPIPQPNALSQNKNTLRSLVPGNVIPQVEKTGTATKPKQKKPRSKACVAIATTDKTSASGEKTGSSAENTGRWTAEEHRLFLQGLEEHGRGWKKIAALIKSRTVVQIRTHAQKYFQKLAKARLNGEEGDIAMEGRGGAASIISGGSSVPNGGQHTKRRRQSNGTKRKSISNIVSAARRDGLKFLDRNGVGRIPIVSPALAPYISNANAAEFLPPTRNPVSRGNGDNSSNVLEDSIYRFLTPATGGYVHRGDHYHYKGVNGMPSSRIYNKSKDAEMNQHKTSTRIMLPADNVTSNDSINSPTGVSDSTVFEYSKNYGNKNQEPPRWYSRGHDVDELLVDADTLDWLADSGDLDETYHPPENLMRLPMSADVASLGSTSESEPEEALVNNSDSFKYSGFLNKNSGPPAARADTLPPVVSCASIAMDSLPALFESSERLPARRQKLYSSSFSGLEQITNNANQNATNMDDGFSDFDTNFDEQAFVSALLLENNENGSLCS